MRTTTTTNTSPSCFAQNTNLSQEAFLLLHSCATHDIIIDRHFNHTLAYKKVGIRLRNISRLSKKKVSGISGSFFFIYTSDGQFRVDVCFYSVQANTSIVFEGRGERWGELT